MDGINDSQSFDFSVLENICDEDVFMKRRNATPGKLLKGTPFLITSNLTPTELFGQVAGDNLTARSMIIDLSDVVLFPIIDNIIEVHNLKPVVLNSTIIPEDIVG